MAGKPKVTINDYTPQVMRDIGTMTHNGVEEFLHKAWEKTKKTAPVRRHLGGNHRDGIANEMLGRRKGRLFSQSNYGAYLEFGTSKMAARPHFGPAIQAAIREMKDPGRWDNL
jgi:hypothetical protein